MKKNNFMQSKKWGGEVSILTMLMASSMLFSGIERATACGIPSVFNASKDPYMVMLIYDSKPLGAGKVVIRK